MGEYGKLLSKCGYQVHLTRIPLAFMVGVSSVFNSIFAAGQTLLKDSAVNSTAITEPPIFIIGHWRSGTTLTHELLSKDSNLAFPCNYDAFVPWHFLMSSGIIKAPIKLLLPGRRPFDDMSIDVEYPQEDDFALMAMGAPSYYQRMGFPSQQEDFTRLLDCELFEPSERKRLADLALYFYKALTLRYGKRLVLKSPPHTARIRLLRELFPDAKFVHLSRHPTRIVPSTMRLWAISDIVHGFQWPLYSDEQLMEHIRVTKGIIYNAYKRDRDELTDNQLVEIKFESLLADPAETIRHIYGKLELPDVEPVLESTREYFDQRSHHKQNRVPVDHLHAQIESEWSDYMEMFGYEKTTGAKAQVAG